MAVGRGGRAAEIVAYWKGGPDSFDDLAPDNQRRAKRQELKSWLKEQFALVKAGKEPTMTILSGPIERGVWQIDAP